MPGTVNQRASPRYLQKTNVSFVREKVCIFIKFPLDKSHFITEVENENIHKRQICTKVNDRSCYE